MRRIFFLFSRGYRALGAVLLRARKGRPDPNRRLARMLGERRIPAFRQIRLLTVVLSPRERQVFTALLAVVAISGVLIATRIVLGRLSYVPARGGTYTEAVVGSPALVNPLYAAANDVDADLARLLFAGLLRRDAQGVYQPDLAEIFSVSTDGKTYRATLRGGLTWSDNSPLTLDDVIFTFETVKDAEWKSPLQGAFRRVSIEREGDNTVRFTLPEPYAGFPEALTMGIIPEHVWGDVLPASAPLAEFNLKPVGSGPYRYKSFTRDRVGTIKTYTVERNPHFYSVEHPYIDRIVFKFFPDFSSAGAALAARQADGVPFLPADIRLKLGSRNDLENHRLGLPQLTAIFFNLSRTEIFGDRAVRRALTLAVDRDRVVSEALSGEGVPVAGPVPIGRVPGYNPSPIPTPDAGAAMKLLDQAGWRLSAGGNVREKITKDNRGRVTASSTLAFRLVTVDRSETVAAAEAVARSWREIGARVELMVSPTSRFQKDVLRDRDFDALLYGEVLGIDGDPYPFWHSSQAGSGGFNLSGFKNRDADALLDAARAAPAAERVKKYVAFEKIITEEAPAAFLYQPFYAYLVDKGVKGVVTEGAATPADRWESVRDWYRKTKPTFKR